SRSRAAARRRAALQAESAAWSANCSTSSALSHQRGGSDMRRSYGDPSPSVLEMHEHSAGVLGILLDPVVAGLDVLAVQEPQHPLLELTAALAGDDLDGPGAGALGLVDDLLEGAVDVP